MRTNLPVKTVPPKPQETILERVFFWIFHKAALIIFAPHNPLWSDIPEHLWHPWGPWPDGSGDRWQHLTNVHWGNCPISLQCYPDRAQTMFLYFLQHVDNVQNQFKTTVSNLTQRLSNGLSLSWHWRPSTVALLLNDGRTSDIQDWMPKLVISSYVGLSENKGWPKLATWIRDK